MSTTHKNICVECGKSKVNGSVCAYDQSFITDGQMSYCPTYIKKKVSRNKPLFSSPFKVLAKFQVNVLHKGF